MYLPIDLVSDVIDATDIGDEGFSNEVQGKW